MKKILFFLILFLFITTPVWAAECRSDCQTIEECQQLIEKCEDILNSYDRANLNNKQTLEEYQTQVNRFEAMIVSAGQQINSLEEEIIDQEANIEVQQIMLADRVRRLYVHQQSFSMLTVFFASENSGHFIRQMFYQQLAANEDKKAIEELSRQLTELKENKEKAEANRIWLTEKKQEAHSKVAFLEEEIAKTEDYLGVLSTTIKELSAKQEALLAARSGTYRTSVGEVPPADDFNASIEFKPQAPSDSFAVFSFGGYTHRNGMSQYGAKARAEEGQSVEDILNAYYPGRSLKKDYAVMDKITVEGVGSIDFENYYLYGIYEMPESWGKEALKAQAVAARTYAIRHTDNGNKPICATEACQVFKNSLKSGAWKEAVEATRNWVLVDDSDSPVSTQYASTHGGYSNTSGWDLNGGYDANNWTTIAWERKAKSPWFYKAWYRAGYSVSGNSCGYSHPWLSQKEFADIINAWIVRNNPSGADINRILPITINECSLGGISGDPYSMDELKEWADKAGGAVTNISNVSVSHNSSGQTTQVNLATNLGSINIGGNEFKEIFNLRAPGYLRIPQRNFAFFNIEKKN